VTRSLAGLTVVVTRPARQALRFTQLLRDRGAATVAFPVLDIEPVTLDASARSALALDACDWVVYTSANAVEFSLPQLGRPARARVAAIGRATARALASAGVQVSAVPETGADSEGLLAHPEFAEPRGQRVLVVKGVGGRDALRAGLAARGAQVSTAEVYRRTRLAPAAAALDELDRARGSGSVAVAVTSVEVLESLLAAAPAGRYGWLRDAPLLVPGERVAAAARRLDWRGPLIVAHSAEDDSMLDALELWSSDGGRITPA
jgi:uroporphyrinogen-III synthase